MHKLYGKPIARCQECNAEIGEDHPYSWCMECGKPLSREVRLQVPGQAAALLAPSADDGSGVTAAALPQTAQSEGSNASTIGEIIIVLSAISAIVCIMAFGRVEVPNGLYSTKTQWSLLLVSVYVAGGLNGMFFGYLLAKVGSVLKHLEKAQESHGAEAKPTI